MPNRPPSRFDLPGRVHVLGACGRMAGGLALALHARGVAVTGTDDRQFPPMSERFPAAGIPLANEWDPAHLPEGTEVVIAGGLIGPDNPEWQAAVARGIPVLSAAAFLESHVLHRTRNTVVAGTKGKTTTTAMLAWILAKAGVLASHLVGGQVRGGEIPLFHLADAADFLLEGDEFPCGPADPVPKFARYRPEHLLITSLAHDHPDVFCSPDDYENIFRELVAGLPAHGCLILNADDEAALNLAKRAACRSLLVGYGEMGEIRLGAYSHTTGGCGFHFQGQKITLSIPGKMNTRNAALALAAAQQLGVPLEAAADALRDFPGVIGRLEPFCPYGRSIFYTEDSSHPLAVGATIETLRQRHPDRRFLAIVFPSNTGGCNGPVQRDLPASLAGVDAVLCLPVIEFPEPPGGPFDSERFQKELAGLGIEVLTAGTLPEMISKAVGWQQDGDILVGFKSVGPAIPWERLAAALLAQSP